jgi:hypothetical protein
MQIITPPYYFGDYIPVESHMIYSNLTAVPPLQINNDTISVDSASNSSSGVVNLAAQTFKGAKTFEGAVVVKSDEPQLTVTKTSGTSATFGMAGGSAATLSSPGGLILDSATHIDCTTDVTITAVEPQLTLKAEPVPSDGVGIPPAVGTFGVSNSGALTLTAPDIVLAPTTGTGTSKPLTISHTGDQLLLIDPMTVVRGGVKVLSSGQLQLTGDTGVTSNVPTHVTDTTPAISTTTGCLTAAGGASIVGDLYVGGTVYSTTTSLISTALTLQNGATLNTLAIDPAGAPHGSTPMWNSYPIYMGLYASGVGPTEIGGLGLYALEFESETSYKYGSAYLPPTVTQSGSSIQIVARWTTGPTIGPSLKVNWNFECAITLPGESIDPDLHVLSHTGDVTSQYFTHYVTVIGSIPITASALGGNILFKVGREKTVDDTFGQSAWLIGLDVFYQQKYLIGTSLVG